MITSTGDNLNVTIQCSNTHHDSWMAYASWYSMQKNIPDAKVWVNLRRSNEVQDYFNWARKRQVLGAAETGLMVLVNCMAVRELDHQTLESLHISKVDEMLRWHYCVDICSDEITPFVSYANFGNFVLSEWINKKECPFVKTKKLESNSINEKKVIELWKKAARTFNL